MFNIIYFRKERRRLVGECTHDNVGDRERVVEQVSFFYFFLPLFKRYLIKNKNIIYPTIFFYGKLIKYPMKVS